MNYILRNVIFEDRWQEQLRELIALCQSARIEEVALMEMSHQIRVSPYPIEKHRRMAEIYRRMGDAFRREGVGFSVNVATLVGHSSMPPATTMLPFQNFVSDDLRPVPGVYCIADPQWQAYAVEVCARYATAKPAKLFVDDDFRSIEHSRKWGCFCPLHVAATARKCGRPLPAEQLLRHLAGATAEDREVKKAWMAATFDAQLQAAHAIQAAVEHASPDTRVGLMNSGEPSHSIQGRDMARLLREFAGPKHRPLSRPGGAAYADPLHATVFRMHQTMALSMSVLSPDVEIVSEVENWPHTRFNKSIRATRLQLELHTLAGADALTLNLYDYLATPFAQEPDFKELLLAEKDRLEKIRQARAGKTLRGFGLPWKPATAAETFSRRRHIDDITPRRELDLTLPQFGVPVQFAPTNANAILGDAVQCHSDQEIKELLAGGLLIDGDALEHLCARGFGGLLGCATAGVIETPTVEKLASPEFSGPFEGNLQATSGFRLPAQGLRIHRLEPAKPARPISRLLTEELADIAPALVLFENELGGRVAVTAVPFTPLQSLYRSKAWQIAKVVDWLMKGALPVWIEDCPNVGPIYYEDAATGEGLLAIVSGNLDRMRVRLHTKLTLADLFTGETPDELWIEPLSVRFFRTSRPGASTRP